MFALIAVVGIALSLQGWKSRLPVFDLIVAIDGAHELSLGDRIPDRGSLSSFASYNPPGPAWLMTPGLLLFRNPQLFEYVGSIALYLGTLFGIFLLARSYFGPNCAILSAALYAVSFLGLQVASSLWDRLPLHFFYVWMVYWLVQWINRKNANYLGAAIVTCALGMYVFLEIAPALFILPAVWIIYRPPLKVRPLIVAILLSLVVWYPYLHFQFTRDFRDAKSLILRRRILPATYKASWCNPGLTLQSARDPSSLHLTSIDSEASQSEKRSVRKVLVERAVFAPVGLLSNFRNTIQIPGTSWLLLMLELTSVLWLAVSSRPAKHRKFALAFMADPIGLCSDRNRSDRQ